MGLIHQTLQSIRVSIRLVHCQPRPGIVSPARVAIEFTDGHEFDGIDAQPLEIVQPVDDIIEVPLGIPIPDEQLIDDEPILCRPLKSTIGPFKIGFDGAEGGHGPGCMLPWIDGTRREGLRWYVTVIPRVQDERRVGVRHFHRIVNQIMETDPGSRIQSFHLEPPSVPIH